MAKNYTLDGISSSFEIGPEGAVVSYDGAKVLINGMPVVVSKPGQPSLLRLSAIECNVNGGNAVYEIGNLPENAIVISCSVNVMSAFTSAPVLKIGNLLSIDGIHTTTDSDISTVGLYTNRAYYKILADTVVYATVSGSGSVGSLEIIIEFYIP